MCIMKIVMSLGGSVITTDRVNVSFLKKFVKMIKKSKHKMHIVTGGGGPSRIYAKGSRKLGLGTREQDALGIGPTLLNAQLLAFLLKAKFVHIQPRKIGKLKPITVSGGFDVGCTTDHDAAMIAETFKADYLLNISDVKGVYTRDPDVYKNAKMFHKMTYDQFLKMFPMKHEASRNVPFEPQALKLCKKNKVKVVVMGRGLNNIKNFLQGKKFVGTIIR